MEEMIFSRESNARGRMMRPVHSGHAATTTDPTARAVIRPQSRVLGEMLVSGCKKDDNVNKWPPTGGSGVRGGSGAHTSVASRSPAMGASGESPCLCLLSRGPGERFWKRSSRSALADGPRNEIWAFTASVYRMRHSSGTNCHDKGRGPSSCVLRASRAEPRAAAPSSA